MSPTIDEHRKTIRRTVTAALLVLLLGTVGYMIIEGWPFAKALFFTIITLTTVGYGDYGLSETGEQFTMVLILIGVGVFLNSLSQLAPIIFNEKIAQERKMKKQIAKLSDHFIICGLGRVGQACSKHLAMKDIPFVCVDPDPQKIAEAVERGHLAMCGDATHDEVLEEAGIRWAKGLAALTDADTENIVITLGARQLNPDLHIVSRAEEIETFAKMQRAGATKVISPVQAGGESIAHAMVEPKLTDMLERTDRAVQGIEFLELTIDEASSLAGQSILECGQTHAGVVFVALNHPEHGTQIHPPADSRLQPGDVLIAAGDALAIGRLQDEAQRRRAA